MSTSRYGHADFKSWSTVLLGSIAKERLRSYMTSLAETTWNMVEWFQHYTGAAPWNAEVVLDATGHFIATYSKVKLAQKDQDPERCPRCGSYRLEDASHLEDAGHLWLSITACAACGWQSEPERQT